MDPPNRPQYVSTDRLVVVGSALVLVAVVAVGLWSAGPGSGGTPTVNGNVSEQYDSIDALSATRTTVIERNGTVSSRAVHSVTLAPGTGKQRLRLVESSADRYDLRISNGSVLWLHERDRNQVTRIPLTGASRTAASADRVHRLLVRANLTPNRSAGAPPAVEPLPVVPQERGQPPRRATAGYAVSYVGTESIDGREAYAIEITPRADSAATYRQTVWVDTEWLYPLKRQTAWRDDGVRTELTTTYTDVSFDATADPGTFRPDIGPNTSVETADTPETTVYRRRGALAANTSLRVPEPELPPSYERTYATRTTGDVRGVGLRYVNRTSEITVSKYNFTYEPTDPDERRRVDGRSATVSRGPTLSVSWNCDRFRYTVRGTGVTVDQLVTVARSVGCPVAPSYSSR
ncbi:LolA family protein [Haloarcula sediminis]|uniref:LolA family protein n=1 Tax=Haloarcula sediminis TaxID=3111777 RepID=UPI002D792DF6|nr:sigma-E factor regulatory protein RseB domain-containing protein [Haloarcula sp. CK38]